MNAPLPPSGLRPIGDALPRIASATPCTTHGFNAALAIALLHLTTESATAETLVDDRPTTARGHRDTALKCIDRMEEHLAAYRKHLGGSEPEPPARSEAA